MTEILSLDLETRSAADLKKTGAYHYFEDATADVLCAALALDDGPVLTWRRGDQPPAIWQQHVSSGGIVAALLLLRAWLGAAPGGGGGGRLWLASQLMFLLDLLEYLSRVLCSLLTEASLALAARSLSSAGGGTLD